MRSVRNWPLQSLIDMICTPDINATSASVQSVLVDFYVHMDFASPYRLETCSKLQCEFRTYVS
jgi:hypothetical protein